MLVILGGFIMLSTRIELVRDIIPTDFKSVASACSATIAITLESHGVEPCV